MNTYDKSILSMKPSKLFSIFLGQCADVGADPLVVRDVATSTISYLKGGSEKRVVLRRGQKLEQQWYESVEAGIPDYSVYGTDEYLGDLWACWVTYSRKYIRTLMKNKDVIRRLGSVSLIVDLGCGIGYTTAAWKSIFPNATVFGTNFEGITQTLIAEQMARQFGFNMAYDVASIKRDADIVFASEYFEHFSRPVKHLHKVLSSLSPSHLLMANSFGARSIGHFDEYEIDGEMVEGKSASKRFNIELGKFGYRKVKTDLWNDRPAYWTIKDLEES
jgi:hypothetical protein